MSLIKMNVRSDVLSLQTNITVILPSRLPKPGQPQDYYMPGMKYQTIWLLHGGSGDDSVWVNYTSVLRYAEENQVAVVMAPACNSFYVDMVHGNRYFTFFTEELPTICRAYFPLSAKREDNIVAGLSMGANGAMRLGLKRPDLYGTVLCMSGVAPEPKEFVGPDGMFYKISIEKGHNPFEDIFGDTQKVEGTSEDMYFVARKNVEENKPMPKFLFGCGGDDFALPGVKLGYELLKGLGYDARLEIVPHYKHEWDFWDLYIRKAICELLDLKREPIYV
jgi:S-formylglutathione hydrolase FrmB